MFIETRHPLLSFQAVLPHGPITLQQNDEAVNASKIAQGELGSEEGLQSEALKLMTLMESQLISIAGHEGKEAVNHAGRAKGPTVTFKCPVQMANGTKRTTPALRAWKCTWKWLGDLKYHDPESKAAKEIMF